MELRFIQPSLRRLDLAGTEVLVAAVTEDERPLGGLAGLLDFRLQGRISKLLKRGFLTGKFGELLMLPGKPSLAFDKLILLGIGRRDAFGDEAYRRAIGRIITTLEGIRVRSAVVELPGRHFGALKPDDAATILLEMFESHPEHDLWTLVEPSEGQTAITQQVLAERRRLRK